MKRKCQTPSTSSLLREMDSVWVQWNFGTVRSAHVTTKVGSTYELRGVAMWHLLNALSQQWQPRVTSEPTSSSKTSPVSESDPDAWRQEAVRW